MRQTLCLGRLEVDLELHEFLKSEVVAGTGISIDKFYSELELTLEEFEPRRYNLLKKRDSYQKLMDQYFLHKKDEKADLNDYLKYLRGIGYIEKGSEPVELKTDNLDEEIDCLSSPQVIAPLDQAGLTLQAVNARWGSLYQAYYGEQKMNNVIDENQGRELRASYNPLRGEAVVRKANRDLDQIIPLKKGSYESLQSIQVIEADGENEAQLLVELKDGSKTSLKNPTQWLGYTKGVKGPRTLIFQHHQLQLELVFDRSHPVGASHPAGLTDILMESACTAIHDLDESCSRFNLEDLCKVYKNWKHLQDGTLTPAQSMGQNGYKRLREDRTFVTKEGSHASLKGRALSILKLSGMEDGCEAILLDGREIPLDILDLFICVWSSMAQGRPNSIYLLSSKLQGPEEVQYRMDLFKRVEEALGIDPYTLKFGMVIDEFRTSLNLRNCLSKAQERMFMLHEGKRGYASSLIKTHQKWGVLQEIDSIVNSTAVSKMGQHQIQVAMELGLHRLGLISKDIWLNYKDPKALLLKKNRDLEMGANATWVSSSTLATLHVLHYHSLDVVEKQSLMEGEQEVDLKDLLDLPFQEEEFGTELQTHVQQSIKSLLSFCDNYLKTGASFMGLEKLYRERVLMDRLSLIQDRELLKNWIYFSQIDEIELEKTLLEVSKEMRWSHTSSLDMALQVLNGSSKASVRDIIKNSLSLVQTSQV